MTHILLVDDDPDIRALVEHHLTAAGYGVALAGSAAEARAAMERRKPDLLIADIAMPGVSGVEFVASLREDPALAGIPVIYLTGLEENTELAIRTLGYPLLAKPVASRELLALVARQLRPAPAAA
jgi:DNA-binding response OmpR family regulator